MQHLRPVCDPFLTSKEEVLYSLSSVYTCTVIRLCDVDPVDVSVKLAPFSPELRQGTRFFPRQSIIQLPGMFPGSAA